MFRCHRYPWTLSWTLPAPSASVTTNSSISSAFCTSSCQSPCTLSTFLSTSLYHSRWWGNPNHCPSHHEGHPPHTECGATCFQTFGYSWAPLWFTAWAINITRISSHQWPTPLWGWPPQWLPKQVSASTPTSGQQSGQTHKILEEGYQELEAILEWIASQTNMTLHQVANAWHKNAGHVINVLNHWNIYQAYFKAHKEVEHAHLDSPVPGQGMYLVRS